MVGPGVQSERSEARSIRYREAGDDVNTAKVMRADPSADGMLLRVWVDDELGRHVTVAECEIPASTLSTWAMEVGTIKAQREQFELDFS